MNTKTAKYKKYLRLLKKQSAIEKRYSFIIESSLGKRESRFSKYRGYSIVRNGAVDYTSVKETLSYVKYERKWYSYNKPYHSHYKYEVSKSFRFPDHPDIVKLNLAIIGKFDKKDNLYNCEISKYDYDNLSIELKDYFYKKLDPWASFSLGYNAYKYLFKYNIPLIEVVDKVSVERYNIFSDITKAYNEIDDEISRLCNNNYKLWYNNTRKSHRDNHRRKARRILKQNLNTCIKYDDFDLIRDKYYGPECDKWDYD